jgi:hypothetical protein
MTFFHHCQLFCRSSFGRILGKVHEIKSLAIFALGLRYIGTGLEPIRCAIIFLILNVLIAGLTLNHDNMTFF